MINTQSDQRLRFHVHNFCCPRINYYIPLWLVLAFSASWQGTFTSFHCKLCDCDLGLFAGTSWHCSYVSLGFQPVVWFLDLRPHRLVSEMIIATPQIRFPLWSWQGNQHAQCAAALQSDQAVRLRQPFYCDYTWVIWQLNQQTSANIRKATTGDHTTDYIYNIIYI